MIREIPKNFKRIYSKEEIAYSVYKMAGLIRHWVKDTHENDGQQVLAICVLRGGVFFFADLLKEIPYTVEPSQKPTRVCTGKWCHNGQNRRIDPSQS